MTMTTNDKRGEIPMSRIDQQQRRRTTHDSLTKPTRNRPVSTRFLHGFYTVFPAPRTHNPRSHHRLRRREKTLFPRRHRSAKRTHPARCCALSSIFYPLSSIFALPPSASVPLGPCGLEHHL